MCDADVCAAGSNCDEHAYLKHELSEHAYPVYSMHAPKYTHASMHTMHAGMVVLRQMWVWAMTVLRQMCLCAGPLH